MSTLVPERVDVCVVGGGPAGAAAARAAAGAGARTVLLDRGTPPRYKTCGGGLVGLSCDHAGVGLDALSEDLVDSVTLAMDGRLPVTHRSRGALLRMVMRSRFDAALLDAAAAQGAEICTGTTVAALEETGDAVTVRLRDGAGVRADVVVAADGSASRSAPLVAARWSRVDLGLEGEFPVAPAVARRWAGRVLLDWGPVPGSYAWLFPKGDLLTVGVIGERGHAEALRRYYRAFVDRLGLSGVEPVNEGGHLTRCRQPDSPVRSPGGRVLLAGDAGGFVEPWTREGISGALRSGRLAGQCAAGDPAAYPRLVEQVLAPDLAAGELLRGVFESHPLAFHLALASPAGWHAFRRLVGGEISLAGTVRRAPVRAALALLSRRP